MGNINRFTLAHDPIYFRPRAAPSSSRRRVSMAFGSLMPPLFTSRLRYEAHPFPHLADAATVLPMAAPSSCASIICSQEQPAVSKISNEACGPLPFGAVVSKTPSSSTNANRLTPERHGGYRFRNHGIGAGVDLVPDTVVVRVDEQSNEHGIMIRSTELVRTVQGGRIELGVVVHRDRFIAVDVPDGRTADIGQQARAGQCVIQVTGLAGKS